MHKRPETEQSDRVVFEKIVAIEDDVTIRLDRYLAEAVGLASRSGLRGRIEALTCNDRPAKLSTRVRAGDRINGVLLPLEPIGADPEDIPLNTLFENENVLVIDKEQGTVVHPGAGNRSGTIANALAWRFRATRFFSPEEGDRPGIVHRLDKDTSGVMIIAKNAPTHAYLVEQFAARRVHKRYLAIVKGTPRPSFGVIDIPIARDRHNRLRYKAEANGGGKEAITDYKTLRTFGRYSLVRFSPRTGRTHQIRAHALAIGCPILGDPLYARRDAEFPDATLMLHALVLEISIEDGSEPRRFRARVPIRFAEAINRLRRR